MRERSNKNRLEITVYDEIIEQGFHGCTQKTIISLELSVRSVLIFGAEKFLRLFYEVIFKEEVIKQQVRVKETRKQKDLQFFCSSFRL